ncbi:unnamed protein product [Dovyalis caffra]|uniref:Uncharacterized protein n=1 Tax=Dovyalis caffra TaxID=77055 RepID=A0AAV1R378_9ROSI|nr:unnamed protein product [Dovyalis caffra]
MKVVSKTWFLRVLSACCHEGLIKEGQSGLLEKGEKLIKTMPIEVDAMVWGALFLWNS